MEIIKKQKFLLKVFIALLIYLKIIKKEFCEILLATLNDFTLKILIFCAFLSIAIEVSTSPAEKRKIAWIEGFAILMAVVISSLVQTINDIQKEKQFQELNKVADNRKLVKKKKKKKINNSNKFHKKQ